MSALNLEDLEAVRVWAQKRVNRLERHRRMAPLFDTLSEGTEMTMTQTRPEIMAEPTARVRQSVLDMEKSDAEWPQSMRRMDERLESQLARVRRRTAALRAWLESLS